MNHTAPDGCRIHYESAGRGGPRVLLIPGLGGDGRFWSGVAADLAGDHRLVIADHRGAGQSDRPAGPYSIATIANDMAGILATTGGPAHVVGHSTGGAVAQVLALDHPELVESLVISAAWARPDARFVALFRARAALIEAGLAEAYQELTHVLGHEAAYLDHHDEALAEAVRLAPERLRPYPVTARRIMMLLDHDRLAELGRIQKPTLVVAAEGDQLIPLAMSAEIADAIPGATLACVPGAHFHPQSNPERLASLVRDFIGRRTP